MKIKYHSDSGHGWLAVKKSLIQQLNMTNKISEYSYVKGNTVYLEEDYDANLFLNIAKKRGIDIEIQALKPKNKSPIRSYNQYEV